MNKGKSVLFAIDDSDFSRQALLKTAELVKKDKDFNITLFHGAPRSEACLPAELIGADASAIEKHRELLNLEAQELLESAKAALIEIGYTPDRLSVILEEECNNPAVSMLKLADSESIQTLALGRWGRSSVSRQIIGSVTYHLAQEADNLALWIIDPRICSYNVLVGLTGAPISHRVVDYTLRHFNHLRENRFTLFHVIPPFPPQGLDSVDLNGIETDEERQKMIGKTLFLHLKEYTEKVKAIARDAREKLIAAGVPEENVHLKIQAQKRGIARDILEELEEGNHGILVIGRRGFKDIKEFGMGSKANKLLIKARAFNLCLVN